MVEESLFDSLRVLPRRLILANVPEEATLPMLRSVFGAALRPLSAAAYDAIFERPEKGHQRAQRYCIRLAKCLDDSTWEIDWICFGHEAIQYDEVLLRAWDIASGMGLGKRRERFHIVDRQLLGPDEHDTSRQRITRGWTLGSASWPLPSDRGPAPC
ncbi:MAG: hypothetical protein KJ052_10960, partial [Candidatus Hydrogenedentes bacterium]|nr:hypothetical protein [Candidatus Hydrogenedentota bacterium]